jgi:DNA repair protein RecO
MSYHIYTTDGIILKRAAFGEANVLLYVLTADLGLIIASARSARLAVSKLRPALQEYAHVSVSVIHGKSGWKITNVSERNNFYFDLPEFSKKVLARIASTLLQMIPGESEAPEIFYTVVSGLEFLKSAPEKDISEFETLAVLRILYQLGYVVSDTDTEIFLKEPNIWNLELLQKISDKKPAIVGIINKALKESQL